MRQHPDVQYPRKAPLEGLWDGPHFGQNGGTGVPGVSAVAHGRHGGDNPAIAPHGLQGTTPLASATGTEGTLEGAASATDRSVR